MNLDRWTKDRDGTLRNGTMWITRVQPNRWAKARWRLDSWHWKRVPEFPDDVAEGYLRVEESHGTFESLRAAKHAGEMRVRSRGGSPRGTLSDWFKVRDQLRDRVDHFGGQFQEGFWDNVLAGDDPHKDAFDISWSFASAIDAEKDVRDLANDLLRIADSMQRRLSRNEIIAKLEAVQGRTPEEAALFRAKAEELKAS